MPKVYIVGHAGAYAQMFLQKGWEVVDSMSQADLVQFTGGADVSPHLYGEKLHPQTGNDERRDIMEMEEYLQAARLRLPCAGICRGGQFLNVMSGGKLYQHVSNHALRGTHEAFSETLGQHVNVTSTHHQMMRPGPHSYLEGWAEGLSVNKQSMPKLDEETYEPLFELGPGVDPEVVFYEGTQCLCFQPHPEFPGADETRDYYFLLLARFFNL